VSPFEEQYAAILGLRLQRVGRRRCLTLWQLHEKPWLGAVLRRYRDKFTYDGKQEVWWYDG
jgi:hypothetical protein